MVAFRSMLANKERNATQPFTVPTNEFCLFLSSLTNGQLKTGSGWKECAQYDATFTRRGCRGSVTYEHVCTAWAGETEEGGKSNK